jgi:GNAT superfamily N-acetyltransferase
MAIKIRPGDLESERDAAVTLLARNVSPAYDGRRFDWLYRDNSAGRGRLWMAEDGSTGALVGVAGALPRWVSIDGDDVRAWVLADFCVDDRHRTLGPATQLQRACFDDLAADGAAICYDFPSRAMEAVYRRLGVATGGRIRRLVRPLRSYRKLREQLGSAVLARPLSALADAALAWGVAASRHLPIALHEDRCGDEFTELFRDVGPRYGACVRRSAEYLNWRYRDNPVEPHHILTARVRGRLVGYSVVTTGAENACLVDVFGVPEHRIITALAKSTVAWLRPRGHGSVSFWLTDSHPWAALLRGLGFRPRESSPIVLHAPAASPWTARAIDPSHWFLTSGDRDA